MPKVNWHDTLIKQLTVSNNIMQYNPAVQKTGHLASMNGKDITYSKFCERLAKSGEAMDEEISNKEREFYNEILTINFSICNAFSQMPADFFDYRPDGLCIEHMIIGMVGEMGELLDLTKNLIIYRKDISSQDKDGKRLDNNFVEEIGDFMFFKTEFCRLLLHSKAKNINSDFIAKFSTSIDDKFVKLIEKWNNLYEGKIRPVTLQMCIEENINKLAKRYSKGKYSDEQAVTRADKQ